MTTLNDASEWEHAQEVKGYDSGSESLNIPTPYEEHHAYIMSQQVRTCLLILLHHLPQCIHIQHNHLKDSAATILYATIWHLAVLTMRILQQIVAHTMEGQNNLHLYNNTCFTTIQMIPSRMPPMKKEEDFPTAPLNDDVS